MPRNGSVFNGRGNKWDHARHPTLKQGRERLHPGLVNLVLIEVQSGEYLEEDDIVRFEDEYGRFGD